MKIALLTYDHPHRKTEDVLWHLLLGGYKSIALVAAPWIERPVRRFLYPHRPGEDGWACEPIMGARRLAERWGLSYEVVPPESMRDHLEPVDPDIVVVGGAGILPAELVRAFPVLNVHPGLLPECRGLDILKWSIIEGKRVGVTAHLCDEYADLGWRIKDEIVPVYPSDTFHLFAMRQYEMENALIVPALEVLKTAVRDDLDRIEADGTESRRRMPRRIEAGLLDAFERYKLIWA